MSRHLPGDQERQPDEKPRRRILGLLDRRSWLFLGMGLAGILTVALIVTADESYAGIDGMRAIRALVPDNETDHPEAPSIPVLGGLVAAIHDLAPLFFAPPANPTAPGPSDPSSGPANSPASPAGPTTSPVPAAQLPGSTTAPPTSTAGPTASPSNSAAPMSPSPSAASSPTPSPTPAPNVALATDRGATAIVDLTDLVPGDSMDRTITVQNTGSLAFRYTLSAMQTASTPLWTDATDGLQLTVRTTGGTILYTGPLSGVGFVAGPTTLGPGTSETLRYTFAFPASASNGLQGLIQDLTFVFDAVEFP
jgi:hypothetical protein